jgi:hypothetical protein
MPKSIQQSTLLYDDVAPAAAPQPNTSKIVVAFLALQTVILITILAGGTYAYGQISDRADQIDAVINVINNPQDLLSNPALVKASVKFLRDTSSAFFLGSSNGTLTAFVENTLMFDFAGAGQQVENFAGSVFNAFATKAANDPTCYQSVTCQQSYMNVQCSNGNWYWCEFQGQQFDCGSCTYAGIASFASVVTSVASRISALPPMNSNEAAASNPALSDGVFRLNGLLSWVQAQANPEAWRDAGRRCNEFANHVNDINWAGNYTGSDGSSQNWDANQQIQPIVLHVMRYCNVFANLPQNFLAPVSAKTSVKKP